MKGMVGLDTTQTLSQTSTNLTDFKIEKEGDKIT